MPEVSAVQQQQPMEIPMESGVVTQQPSAGAEPPMDSEVSMRGGCGESIDCCGITEGCGCC
ncbi:hypothetical protein M406DRAFT_321113 [Cryphonectria parasitica EP155]|uniref:Uncharacterized protein n=1 Tax=Cryphonectria parasitica (strain ATCC 38755 / EP155) TaxID=660469 RepID=A0A9P5CT40_CRYP1|nr:uncharacterized protein M406DRAFT_321113 [Cryphonectria parasitica EP155]KAF3769011.1 hypothetical protein M406DRAFT_321113 [Cryphonectria parasitica EP155]